MITIAIDALPFKIELKALVSISGKFYQTFVIPDHVNEFQNRDLDA